MHGTVTPVPPPAAMPPPGGGPANMPHGPAYGRRHRWPLLALGLITLLAAALRLWNLGTWSFWGDELLTVRGTPDGFNYGLLSLSFTHLLVQATTRWLGVGEWSARLGPALVGVISIPILFVPLRAMLGTRAALAGLLLLAVSPWHLYWSQNARFYALLLLFYSLALFSFFLGLERDRPAYLALALAFLVLAARERLLAFFLPPVVVAYCLALAALAPAMRPAGLRARNLALLGLPCLLAIWLLSGDYLRHLGTWLHNFGYVNNSSWWLLGGTAVYLGLPLVCAGATGAWFLWRHPRTPEQRRAVLLLTISAVLPLATLAVLATFHYTANRYAFVTLTSWAALAGVAATELLRRIPAPTRWLAVGGLAVLVVAPLADVGLYMTRQNGNRDDWRGAFALVRDLRCPGEPIVAADADLARYYLGEEARRLSSLRADDLDQFRQSVWVVTDMNPIPAEVRAWLVDKARLVGVRDVHFLARTFEMRVWRYDPPGAPPRCQTTGASSGRSP